MSIHSYKLISVLSFESLTSFYKFHKNLIKISNLGCYTNKHFKTISPNFFKWKLNVLLSSEFNKRPDPIANSISQRSTQTDDQPNALLIPTPSIPEATKKKTSLFSLIKGHDKKPELSSASEIKEKDKNDEVVKKQNSQAVQVGVETKDQEVF